MTTTRIPDFFDSPYFVMESDNWHLKDGAPPEVKKEFEQYMKDYDESMKRFKPIK